MLGELIYILNGEKSNGNKRKNVLGKKWEDRISKKWLKQGHRIDNAVHYNNYAYHYYFWDQSYFTL